MLERSSFIIDPADYPEGFYLVIVKANDECGNTDLTENSITRDGTRIDDDHSFLSKKVKITIQENSPISNYWYGPGLICLGYLIVFIFSYVTLKCVMKKEVNRNIHLMFDIAHAKGLANLEEVILETPMDDIKTDKVDNGSENRQPKTVKKKRKTDKTVPELFSCIGMENPDKSASVYKRNQLHWVILLLTGIFYCLPTIQLVLDSSSQYKETGNQDYCYYNSLCQRPLGELRDYNHIFSNLGYAVLGLLFIWVVYKKELYSKTLDTAKGVPRQFSIFYALGLSLIGVGIMSSCYHVCPTNVTFQFDTTYSQGRNCNLV